jgi:hypothetical protein
MSDSRAPRWQAATASGRDTRASDADRDRAAAALSGHYAAGRLTLEEFQERLDRAYAAKTVGNLEALMTDLPRADLSQLVGSREGSPLLPGRRTPGTIQAAGGGHPAVWPFWAGVAIAAFVIWLISGAAVGPWFLWLAIPLVLIMMTRWHGDQQRVRHGGRRADHAGGRVHRGRPRR